MAAPSVRAVGTETVTNGTDNTPVIPTHATGDILLAFVGHTRNSDMTCATAGWAEVTDSPQGIGTGASNADVRLEIWWKRAASASETNPTFQGAVNTTMAFVVSVQDCIQSGDPFDDTAGTTHSADGTVPLPALLTTQPETRVIYGGATTQDTGLPQFSSESSADLTSFGQIFDVGSATGGGLGLGAWSGSKTTAGAVSAGQVTGGGTSHEYAIIGVVLKGISQSITPGVGSIVLTGFVPTVTASDHKSVTPGLGSIVLTGFPPTVTASTGTDLVPGLGSIVLTGFPPTVAATAHVNVTPGLASLVVTGFAPTAPIGTPVTPTTGTLSLSGFAPTVTVSENVFVTPGVGAIIVTGFAPTSAITEPFIPQIHVF